MVFSQFALFGRAGRNQDKAAAGSEIDGKNFVKLVRATDINAFSNASQSRNRPPLPISEGAAVKDSFSKAPHTTDPFP